MRYLVELTPTAAEANRIDAGEGPGPIFAYIAERFKPEALYGNPTRRGAYLVVELETPAQMAELMYLSAWALGTDPVFTPLISPEVYGEAIAAAKKAPFLASGIPR